MKECIYKSYNDLPLMLNAEIVKDVLGISISSAYELMHRKDFPSVHIGNRMIVPKDKRGNGSRRRRLSERSADTFLSFAE